MDKHTSYLQSDRPHSSDISCVCAFVCTCQAEKRIFLCSCILVQRVQLHLATPADLPCVTFTSVLQPYTHIHLISGSLDVFRAAVTRIKSQIFSDNVISLFSLTCVIIDQKSNSGYTEKVIVAKAQLMLAKGNTQKHVNIFTVYVVS